MATQAPGVMANEARLARLVLLLAGVYCLSSALVLHLEGSGSDARKANTLLQLGVMALGLWALIGLGARRAPAFVDETRARDARSVAPPRGQAPEVEPHEE